MVFLLAVPLDMVLLREETLLRLEDLGVTVLAGVLLIDREGVEILEEPALVDEVCRLFDAEEDLDVCRLRELLSLDLLLLPAKTGSMVSIKAKNSVPTTISKFL